MFGKCDAVVIWHSGKSALGHCCLGVVTPWRSHVMIDNLNINDLNFLSISHASLLDVNR